ncbi:DUF3934 family protein [Paenibacillus sp. HB172176]|uniref:DUF3934 family protein n=1 Tax=Paenibacillus sp. HB172176 TaxID=2493690 RepID=UPI00143C2A80|nr:DUF3934 family protein [Paenibacillus sp. HB172176]
MSGSKGKGGTGRGTGKKGWNRWQAAEKKKSAKRVFAKPAASKGKATDKSGASSADKGKEPDKQ